MSRAALSVMVFGVYMAAQSVALMIAPNVLTRLFMLPDAQDHWVRVVGLALMIFAFYYVAAARLELTAFFRLTVPGRTLQLVLFVLLIGTGVAPWPLILAALTEFAAGLWTHFALKADAKSPKVAVRATAS